MAERFERLFQLQTPQYIYVAPVIISAGVLLKDGPSGSIITQLKLQSVSEKQIKAVKISLAAYDVSGKELRGVIDYQFLELSVVDGQEFGANKAIVMPDPVTRSFKITSLTVVFADGSIWESASEFLVLPSLQELKEKLSEAELEKQYRIETTSESKYVPQEVAGLWQCACGRWNGSNQCTSCRTSKEKVFSAFEVPYLTDRMNQRLEQEQIQREIELARQAQLAEKRKLMRKRLKGIVPVALLLAIIIGVGSAVYTKSKEVTIEKLLALRNLEDVTGLLGKAQEHEYYDYYDIEFMKEEFRSYFYYEGNKLDFWRLDFVYPGLNSTDNLSAIEKLAIEAEVKKEALPIFFDALEDFTKKFGGPEIYESDCKCVNYIWIVNDRMIELRDRREHMSHFSDGSVVEIRVNCDHQSFCKHTDFEVENALATCINDGYSRKTCATCGYVEEEIYSAFGHTLTTTVTQEATCVEEGKTVSVCSVCGNTTTERIKPLLHTYDTKIIKKTTCTESGSQSNTCTRCGDVYTESVPAYGHSWLDATCTQPKRCANCNITTGNSLGHTWASPDATCSACGVAYEPNLKFKLGKMPAPHTFTSYDEVFNSSYTIKSVNITSKTVDHINSSGTAFVDVELEIVYSYEDSYTDPHYKYKVIGGCSGKISAYNSAGETDPTLWTEDFYLCYDRDTYKNGLYYDTDMLFFDNLVDGDTYDIIIEVDD